MYSLTGPSLTEFIRLCKRLSEERSLLACHDAFRQLLASRDVCAHLNAQLVRLIHDPSDDASEWNPDQLIIESNARFALHCALHRKAPRHLYSSPSEGLIGVLGAEPLRYRRYLLPPNWTNEVYDPAVRPRLIGDYLADPGTTLVFGPRDVVDIQPERPVLLLKLFSTRLEPLLWSFDRESLAPRQVYASDLVPSILSYMMQVVSHYGDAASVGALRKLRGHPQHFLRWEAVKGLARLHRAEALIALQQSLHDPHPHIRRAAARTLERLRAPARTA